LPLTGSNNGPLMVVALSAMALGGLLVLLSGRPASRERQAR
jgi:LPXTG-motif cell wall-anchored protein